MAALKPRSPQNSAQTEEDIDLFLQQFDREIKLYENVPENQTLYLLELQWNKEAKSLIQKELQWLADNAWVPAPTADNPAATRARTDAEMYEHVRNSLVTLFRAQLDHQYHYIGLQTRLKTDSETLLEYIDSVLRLCRRAGIVRESSVMLHLYKGLPLQLTSCIKPTGYPTLQAFLTDVQRAYTSHSLRTLETGQPLPASLGSSVLPRTVHPSAFSAPESESPPMPSFPPSHSAFASAVQRRDPVVEDLLHQLQSLVLNAQHTAHAVQPPPGDRPPYRAFDRPRDVFTPSPSSAPSDRDYRPPRRPDNYCNTFPPRDRQDRRFPPDCNRFQPRPSHFDRQRCVPQYPPNRFPDRPLYPPRQLPSAAQYSDRNDPRFGKRNPSYRTPGVPRDYDVPQFRGRDSYPDSAPTTRPRDSNAESAQPRRRAAPHAVRCVRFATDLTP